MFRPLMSALALALAACLLPACAPDRQAKPIREQQTQNETSETAASSVSIVQPETVPERGPDVVFVPTPQEAVDRMLDLAEIKQGDLIYDLGCGDGRFVVTAAKKFGVRAVGVDIDPERVEESRENVRANNVEHLVTILHADIFEIDFSHADVVTLYLLPELNVKLMPQLRQLKPGSRILSYEFDMRGAKPNEVVTEALREEDGYHYTIYKWIVPWEEE